MDNKMGITVMLMAIVFFAPVHAGELSLSTKHAEALKQNPLYRATFPEGKQVSSLEQLALDTLIWTNAPGLRSLKELPKKNIYKEIAKEATERASQTQKKLEQMLVQSNSSALTLFEHLNSTAHNTNYSRYINKERIKFLIGTILNFALNQRNESLLQALINVGAKMNLPEENDCHPLMKELKNQKTPSNQGKDFKDGMIKLLVNLGADPNHTDSEGNNLLMSLRMPSENFDRYPAEKLIALGTHVNHRNNQGETPLTRAIDNYCLSAVRLFVKSGARLDSAEPYSKITPFEYARTKKMRCDGKLNRKLLDQIVIFLQIPIPTPKPARRACRSKK